MGEWSESADVVWAALQRTPYDEIRQRVGVIATIREAAPIHPEGAVAYGWQNERDTAAWFFTPDRRILLVVHDQASPLADAGDSLLGGVPDELLAVLPEGSPATGVFWYDTEQWRVADGLLSALEARGLELGATGVGTCLEHYRFGQPFSPEALRRIAAPGHQQLHQVIRAFAATY